MTEGRKRWKWWTVQKDPEMTEENVEESAEGGRVAGVWTYEADVVGWLVFCYLDELFDCSRTSNLVSAFPLV